MFKAGVFVNPVLAPAVMEGCELLRTSYMATHTDDQMAQVLDIFGKSRPAGGADRLSAGSLIICEFPSL